jgi:hypothetical protein
VHHDGAPEVVSGGNADPTLTPRGWWKADPEKRKAVGLDTSLIVLRDVLKERRFDVCFTHLVFFLAYIVLTASITWWCG